MDVGVIFIEFRNMKAKTLQKQTSFFITPTSPFHFDGTFHKPSHFPSQLDEWQPGVYWQGMWIGKRLFGLKVENKGSVNKPKIRVIVFSDRAVSHEEIQAVKNELIWRFDLNADLKEFNKLAKQDTRFYPVFKKWIGTRNSSPLNLYELLIIAVVLQNATVRRTVQMTAALLKAFGTKLVFDGKELFVLWQPERLERVSEQDLRDLKIGYRAKFIKRVSGEFASGMIDESRLRTLDQAETKKELMKLYGVGPETARILLFEVCHQYNTFDHIAPWQQKIYSRLFYGKPLVPATRVRNDIKRQYGKYSMLAVHIIWEDIFWRRKHEKIDWLEKEIRL